ncbi:hypothetical protein C8Q79DRAFT_577491 [Trametes meyenii]|nr:hypothetical protein C8Q79DRAFT_577491 [Trametes meyenii]
MSTSSLLCSTLLMKTWTWTRRWLTIMKKTSLGRQCNDSKHSKGRTSTPHPVRSVRSGWALTPVPLGARRALTQVSHNL